MWRNYEGREGVRVVRMEGRNGYEWLVKSGYEDVQGEVRSDNMTALG